jgi:hypothetical protein
MEELLKQLREAVYKKREDIISKMEDPNSRPASYETESDKNIINNRTALILGAITDIERNLQFLNNRY